MSFIVLLFIRAPFYVLLVFISMCSVFWLFWLSCHDLPSDWLERPLWGSLTVAKGLSPASPGRRVLLLYLLYFYYVSALAPGPKVPLNTRQTNILNRPVSVYIFNRWHRCTAQKATFTRYVAGTASISWITCFTNCSTFDQIDNILWPLQLCDIICMIDKH